MLEGKQQQLIYKWATKDGTVSLEYNKAIGFSKEKQYGSVDLL